MAANSFDGSVELEYRWFWDDPDFDFQSNHQGSARLLAEFFTDWNDGDDSLVIEPFARIDSEDDERSHTDLRQFLWTAYRGDFEFSAGLGRVFWGVTETQHLVDIVNQTDLVENIDGEDKLGQPWLKATYFSDIGTIDVFALPYFRERSFVGTDSRLSGGLKIIGDAIYEDDDEENHVDYALRYSNTFDAWDVGISYFDGTARAPDLSRLFD
ncbi:MAG: hypothetical protein AAF197_05975, partial [Pseudomonadota bacterium]